MTLKLLGERMAGVRADPSVSRPSPRSDPMAETVAGATASLSFASGHDPLEALSI